MKQLVARAAVVALAALLAPIQGAAQLGDFKVAWITIGEVTSAAAANAAPLQPGTKVVRVDVLPTIVEVAVGAQVCISSLQMLAFDAQRRPIAGVPLVMAVRQDHKPQLQLTHSKGICMRPARKGEYPIRFTSKVPAPDDTLRGAQVFLRVS
jgi:hypothetical protein